MIPLLRERIRTKLELHDLGLRPFAAFDVSGRSPGVGRPHAPALPARFRIVDAPVEAREMTARQWQPDDSVAIDVHAARPVSIHGRLGLVPRHLVDFRQSGSRWVLAGIQPNDRAGKAQHRAPDRTIDRTHADAVEARHDPLVFGRIDWSVWLHVVVALAVAIGVENERRPTL